jgi:hypothetical protein
MLFFIVERAMPFVRHFGEWLPLSAGKPGKFHCPTMISIGEEIAEFIDLDVIIPACLIDCGDFAGVCKALTQIIDYLPMPFGKGAGILSLLPFVLCEIDVPFRGIDKITVHICSIDEGSGYGFCGLGRRRKAHIFVVIAQAGKFACPSTITGGEELLQIGQTEILSLTGLVHYGTLTGFQEVLPNEPQ